VFLLGAGCDLHFVRVETRIILTPVNPQEKVEEDKFVRAQTQQQIEKLRAEKEKSAADAQAALDTKLFAEQVLPSIKEVKALLKSSEQLSEETVEKIVRWKFGM